MSFRFFGGNPRSGLLTPVSQRRLLSVTPTATTATPPPPMKRGYQRVLSPSDIKAYTQTAESIRKAQVLASPGAGIGRARQGRASPAKIIMESKRFAEARANRLQSEAKQAEMRAKAAARKASAKAEMQERLKSLESVRSEAAATGVPYKQAKALADKEYAEQRALEQPPPVRAREVTVTFTQPAKPEVILKQSKALTSKLQEGRKETQRALSESAAEIEMETRRMFQRLPRFQAAEKAIEKGLGLTKVSLGRVVEEIPRKSGVGRQFQRARQSRRSEFARTQAAGGGMGGGDQMLLWFGLPALQQTAQQVLGGRFEQPSFTTEQYYEQIAAQQGIFPQA